MIFLIVTIISIISILIGKLLLKKWFNHITLYTAIWGVLILLYELRLLPYIKISVITWFYVISAFLSFILGVITISVIRNFSGAKQILIRQDKINLKIFADNGKAIMYSILLFSFIALYAAFQSWSVLISMFGSIQGVLINANTIYRMNSSGDIKGIIPYISYAGYLAVFLSGIYTAYQKKFSLITFLPILIVIIREIANVGRVGMLFALFEFLISFLVFRHLLNDDIFQRFKFRKTNALVAIIILFAVFFVSSSIVRITRVSTEDYTGASRGLKQFRNSLFISPSLYLYLSSDLGVLEKYLNSEGENSLIGQHTFLPVYNFNAKIGLVERPPDFQKGYFIPMWVNTGTYIREIHADFGMLGPFIIPYILGLILTWSWFSFFEKKSLIAFVILVFFNLIISFSFLVMISRLLYWFMCFIFLLVYLPIIEKIVIRIAEKKAGNVCARS